MQFQGDCQGGYQGGNQDGYDKNRGQPSRGQQVSLPLPTLSHIGGRLTRFGQAWRNFSNDPCILSTLIDGYSIDFISEPIQYSFPKGCVKSKEMEQICDSKIETLLLKAAIRAVSPVGSKVGFISKIFYLLEAIYHNLSDISILRWKILNQLNSLLWFISTTCFINKLLVY